MSFNYSYIGAICEVLDKNKVEYHHCYTWFRLFFKDQIYSISAIKTNDDVDEVIIYLGDNITRCINTNVPSVFQGTLKDFECWLQNKKRG